MLHLFLFLYCSKCENIQDLLKTILVWLYTCTFYGKYGSKFQKYLEFFETLNSSKKPNFVVLHTFKDIVRYSCWQLETAIKCKQHYLARRIAQYFSSCVCAHKEMCLNLPLLLCAHFYINSLCISRPNFVLFSHPVEFSFYCGHLFFQMLLV